MRRRPINVASSSSPQRASSKRANPNASTTIAPFAEEVSTPTCLWKIWLISLASRLVGAWLVRTYFNPDEYWQSVEVAHGLAFGYGYRTWEWKDNARIRGFVHPLLFAAAYRACAWLGAPRCVVVAAPRVVQALINSVGDLYTYRLARRVFITGNVAVGGLTNTSLGNKTRLSDHKGENGTNTIEASNGNRFVELTALCALFAQLTNWFSVYCLARTFSNSVEAAFTMMALYNWPLMFSPSPPPLFCERGDDEANGVDSGGGGGDSRGGVQSRRDFVFTAKLTWQTMIWRRRCALGCAALAFAFRPTNGMLWLPLALHHAWTLARRRPPSLLDVSDDSGVAGVSLLRARFDCVLLFAGEILCIGAAVVAATVATDATSAAYGTPTLVPLNFLRFNALRGGSALYGTNSWHYYASEAIPVMLGAYLPLCMLGVWLTHREYISGGNGLCGDDNGRSSSSCDDGDGGGSLYGNGGVASRTRSRRAKGSCSGDNSDESGDSGDNYGSCGSAGRKVISKSKATASPLRLLAVVAWFCVVFSSNAHKEYRFVVPILPLLMIFVGRGFAEIIHAYTHSAGTGCSGGRRLADAATQVRCASLSPLCHGRPRTAAIAAAASVCVNFFMLLYFALRHQRAPIAVMEYLSDTAAAQLQSASAPLTPSSLPLSSTPLSSWSSSRPLVSIDFLMGCHSTPYYSLFHFPNHTFFDSAATVSPSPRFPLRFLPCAPSTNASGRLTLAHSLTAHFNSDALKLVTELYDNHGCDHSSGSCDSDDNLVRDSGIVGDGTGTASVTAAAACASHSTRDACVYAHSCGWLECGDRDTIRRKRSPSSSSSSLLSSSSSASSFLPSSRSSCRALRLPGPDWCRGGGGHNHRGDNSVFLRLSWSYSRHFWSVERATGAATTTTTVTSAEFYSAPVADGTAGVSGRPWLKRHNKGSAFMRALFASLGDDNIAAVDGASAVNLADTDVGGDFDSSGRDDAYSARPFPLNIGDGGDGGDGGSSDEGDGTEGAWQPPSHVVLYENTAASMLPFLLHHGYTLQRRIFHADVADEGTYMDVYARETQL